MIYTFKETNIYTAEDVKTKETLLFEVIENKAGKYIKVKFCNRIRKFEKRLTSNGEIFLTGIVTAPFVLAKNALN